jgi:hypothetical protein
VAAGYLRTNPLALALIGTIAAFYLMGARELQRFDQDTHALAQALAAPADAAADLPAWLAKVPATLRSVVSLRFEGERVGLPGPALTPYLAGFLVLLGMLGTFLGMVLTLSGTGAALERASDLQTMRDSLAAPVKGLGLAFGTSVAGVAASAMLGLMSALCRRARQQVAQQLDAAIAGPLRGFTRAHRLEQQTLKAQQSADQAQLLARQQQEAQHQQALHSQAQLQQAHQQQAEATAALVAQLQAAMAQQLAQADLAGRALTQAQSQSHAQLLASQQHFLAEAQQAYQALTASVGQALQNSLTASARVAADTIQPVVQATMSGITRETAALHGHIASTVQQQLDGLSARFDASTQNVTQTWTTALQQHEATSAALAQRLGATLDGFGQRFDERSASLVGAVAQSHAALLTSVAQSHAALGAEVATTLTNQMTGVSSQLTDAVQQVSGTWHAALAQQARTGDGLAQTTQQSLAAAASQMEHQAAALLQALEAQQSGLQTSLAARDEQRLAAWTATLATLATTLQHGWQQAGEQAQSQQAQICQTLEATAGRIAAQAEAHARSTIGEIAGLAQTAAEAPRLAAELVGQLRDKLSDSMARDTAMLDERARIMATLNTLLDAVQHTATEQRAAIDRLVESTADWLQQAGARFTEKVDAESARMESVSAQLTGSAVDVASLGEAFGLAVTQFGQSSDKLMAHLQRVDETLGQAITRSDEQLAYYVAQAREVIDLSISSQQQIVEDLQKLTGQHGDSTKAVTRSNA